jgi:uncharacterized protein YkwD
LETSALRGRWFFAALLAALLLASVAAGIASANAAPAYDPEELRVVRLINDYRQQNGLEPLLVSDTLSVSSERHSEDMGEHGFFAHNTVASSYYQVNSAPWDRMAKDGYDYNTFTGENIAAGFETADEAFEAWRNSPSHNHAMLDANYRVIGVGRVNAPGSRYGWYWTTDFGGKVDSTAHAPGEAPPREGEPDKLEPERPAPEPDEDLGGIENGDMESETVWEQDAKDGADLILDGRARLGGYDNGKDDLRQKVRVGPDTHLSYGLKITTDEKEHPSDVMVVRVMDEEGEPLATLERYTDADAGNEWRRDRVSLSRFAGETVYVSFSVETDPRILTTFYLDDMVLERD